jgi:putative ABC transport system permease protein
VVGVIRPPTTTASGYATYSYLSRVTREVGRASSLTVATERHDGAYQVQTAEALEAAFDDAGMSASYVSTVEESRAAIGVLFNIIVVFLMAMAVLVAVVGGIGLTGTMLLNVLERIREIGVMRAIGARTDAVLQIFIVEGAIIGLLSWLVAVVLAWPLGKLLSTAVGMQFLSMPLVYSFSLVGAGIWLVLAVLLSAVASYFPAQNAARLTVREVLSYQ